MDEYIKQRQAVLNDICQKRYGCDYEGDCPSCAYTTPLAAAPAANVVPVVRCGDCKYSTLPSVQTQIYGKPGTRTCHNKESPCNRRNVFSDDFCRYGDGKNDADEPNRA